MSHIFVCGSLFLRQREGAQSAEDAHIKDMSTFETDEHLQETASWSCAGSTWGRVPHSKSIPQTGRASTTARVSPFGRLDHDRTPICEDVRAHQLRQLFVEMG